MTLIELVVAIVILGAALAGVLSVFEVTVKSSADPMIHKQMLAVAEEMMEEIVLKPYVPIANSAPIGCARSTYNDLSDYDQYATSSQICDVDGTPISSLAGYSVNVSVTADATSFAGSNVTVTKKITVTVSRGTASLSLVGWRANYAS